MPDFPITDSHVHLYDVERFRYPWLDNVPKLKRSSLPVDLDHERGPVEIDKIVFVEVDIDQGLNLREAEFVQALSDRDPRICAMVAHAPLEKGKAVEPDLVALKAHRIMRGVRRLIEKERDPSMCLEPAFLEGVNLLARHGLSFDICVKHWGLVYAIELVRRCPEVSFILDHIGKPDIRNGLGEPWRSAIRALATLPNVVCKISGVITEADHANWTKTDVEPFIAEVILAFGFDRVMFGSDWTVSRLTHAYPTFVEILDGLLDGASETERRKFYRDNAIRAYRLEE